MTENRPRKKAPAKAGADDLQSFSEWRQGNPIWMLLSRRPLELTKDEVELIEGRIEASLIGAARGWSDAANDLLMISEAYLRSGCAPPAPLGSWLADRLASVAAYDTPWDVPLLKRKRGQKGADNWHVQLVVASYFDQLIRNGAKREVAWRSTRDDLEFLFPGLTEAKIVNAWRKLRGSLPSS